MGNYLLNYYYVLIILIWIIDQEHRKYKLKVKKKLLLKIIEE